MTKTGNEQFQDVLKDFVADLEDDGYRVILLKGKSPDAVAVRVEEIHYGVDYGIDKIELKICAVDVLGKTYRKGRGYEYEIMAAGNELRTC